jgi:hypothetical protein
MSRDAVIAELDALHTSIVEALAQLDADGASDTECSATMEALIDGYLVRAAELGFIPPQDA